MKFKLPTRKNKAEPDAGPATSAEPPPKRDKKIKLPKTKKVKTAATKSLKTYKVPKGRHYILSIGDEGVILTYLKNKQVEGRWFAATPSEENFDVFSKAIAADTKAGMLIVLDTMDQIFSQQTFPPVSKMSLNGLIKRRMKREFGDQELKGYYLLDRAETKEWNFMIFAVEQREEMIAWFNWVAEQPVRPLGIRLAPLEMTQLAQILYHRRAHREDALVEENKMEWKFIVSHNKVSGFRQVIVRNDKMIFTRLSQTLDGGANVQAGMVEQEVSSTIEYLKRIGLKSYQDIHLNIIAADDMLQLLDMKKIGVPSHELLSPYNISQKIGWDSITQPEDRFGDVFLGVFSLTNKKPLAQPWTKSLEKLSKLYKISPVLRLVGMLLALGALGYSGISAFEWWKNSDEAEQASLRGTQLTAELETTRRNINMPAEELDQALETFDLYKSIRQKELAPKDFLIDLASAFANMPEDMRVQIIEWNEVTVAPGASAPAPVVPNPTEANSNAQQPPGKPVAVTGILNIKISVPKGIKSEALANRTNGIIEKLQSYFKHYKITLKEIPGANSTRDTLNIDLSKPKAEQEEGFDTILLNTLFEGTEYIPEPSFEN